MRAPLGRSQGGLSRSVLSCYTDAPLAARAHVRVRWATCPFLAVVAQLPPGGRVLEIGCGHGLFSIAAALDGVGSRVVRGIDVDEGKIACGQRAAARAQTRGADCALDVSPPGSLPAGPWDAVAIVDVLYLLDAEIQREVVSACAEALAPGGTLLIKEVDVVPRSKYAWNRMQETVAVKVLNITAGDQLTFLGASGLGGAARDAGLAVRHLAINRGYPHPHHLVVARKLPIAVG